ncbi:MAG: hypothetical protein LBB48_03695 [Treponema sp.]|nr:hypothetical protein [Treponema sp.]
MSLTKNWFPGTRAGQLAMGKNRAVILSARGAAQNVATRTPVATAQCKEAFDRAGHGHQEAVFSQAAAHRRGHGSLGLKPRDNSHTPAKAPAAQVTGETFLVGHHERGIRIVYVTGEPDDKANKGYRVWYGVIAPGETPPAGPDDLRKSFFTRRKKDVIEFGFGDSGKAVYFAVQIENDGKKGPWGPMVNALIP